MKFHLALVSAALLTACATREAPYKPVEVTVSATPVPSAALGATGVQRIAFGSCSKQHLPQPLWKRIIADRPDLFIWTGDVVYADTDDMGKLSAIYASELQQADYGRFLDSGIPVIGIYDDHDYGENDGGKDYLKKDASKALFLDFIGEPKDSPRRKRPGIFTSYVFGPAGKQVKVILLDTRYHREKPGKNADILGKEQWDWLENEVKSSQAQLNLVVSSIQVLPFEHDFEKWQNFPKARERLLKLLQSSKNVLIISGDRHLAELSQLKEANLWEVTSSGMTHSFQNPDEKRNRNSLRVGPVYDRLNYGFLTIDWTKRSVQVEVRSINQEPVLTQTLSLQN